MQAFIYAYVVYVALTLLNIKKPIQLKYSLCSAVWLVEKIRDESIPVLIMRPQNQHKQQKTSNTDSD